MRIIFIYNTFFPGARFMSVSLEDLQVGDIARVSGFRETSDYTRRLTRLGLVPGTEIEVKRVAPLGDPIEIRFRGFSLVLRPAEAQSLILNVP